MGFKGLALLGLDGMSEPDTPTTTIEVPLERELLEEIYMAANARLAQHRDHREFHHPRNQVLRSITSQVHQLQQELDQETSE